MSNYKELLDTIEPASSDEAFTNRIIRKAEEKQTYSRGGGFKSLYVLTAMILVFGIGAITAGIVWNSDFFKVPEAPPVIIPELWDNAHEKYTSEVSVLYADESSYFVSVSIKSTGEPLPRGYTGRYHVEIYPEVGIRGYGYTEVEYINDYEIQANFRMFDSTTLVKIDESTYRFSTKDNPLQVSTEYTITFKESGMETAINRTRVVGPHDFVATFVYGGAESHMEDVIVVYPDVKSSSGEQMVEKVMLGSFGTIIYITSSELRGSEYYGKDFNIIYRTSKGDVERSLTSISVGFFGGLIVTDALLSEAKIDIHDIEAIIYMGAEIPIK